jgi:hypothetical protein
MSKCEDVQAELSAYLDGELTAEEMHALDAHLCLCDNCNAVLSELEAVRDSLAALPKLPAPPAMAAKVQRALEAEPALPQDRPAKVSLFPKVAFALAALLLLGLLLHFISQILSQPEALPLATAVDKAKRGKPAPAATATDDAKKSQLSASKDAPAPKGWGNRSQEKVAGKLSATPEKRIYKKDADEPAQSGTGLAEHERAAQKEEAPPPADIAAAAVTPSPAEQPAAASAPAKFREGALADTESAAPSAPSPKAELPAAIASKPTAQPAAEPAPEIALAKSGAEIAGRRDEMVTSKAPAAPPAAKSAPVDKDEIAVAEGRKANEAKPGAGPEAFDNRKSKADASRAPAAVAVGGVAQEEISTGARRRLEAAQSRLDALATLEKDSRQKAEAAKPPVVVYRTADFNALLPRLMACVEDNGGTWTALADEKKKEAETPAYAAKTEQGKVAGKDEGEKVQSKTAIGGEVAAAAPAPAPARVFLVSVPAARRGDLLNALWAIQSGQLDFTRQSPSTRAVASGMGAEEKLPTAEAQREMPRPQESARKAIEAPARPAATPAAEKSVIRIEIIPE